MAFPNSHFPAFPIMGMNIRHSHIVGLDMEISFPWNLQTKRDRELEQCKDFVYLLVGPISFWASIYCIWAVRFRPPCSVCNPAEVGALFLFFGLSYISLFFGLFLNYLGCAFFCVWRRLMFNLFDFWVGAGWVLLIWR